ncbi:hypothetical protein Vadar_012475 [Vaccinium darrowii]|uniref:Uncharacterized protein n=1 Tax=Vaccinium darrowii TaxID=229202 RepID=A0ACB7ZJY9_9ERIC|nr:hypothetical protein Vadar_012475 [Vaccinium darrowii]
MASPPHRGRCRDGGGGRFRAEAEVEESGTEVESLTQDEVEEQEDAVDTQPPGGPEDRSLLRTEAKNALEEAKGGQAVMFDWLRMYFSELRESDTDERLKYYSRAYLLNVFGCTLLCDKTGSKVNVAPLALLEDLDRVSHCGWGASALAFLYWQLGQASRRDTKQLSGFLTLLEAWIYEHFPMFNPVADPDYTEDLPRALRWVLRHKSGISQSYYPKLLDDLGADQVIFNPYQKRRQVVPSNAFYTGPIRAMHIVEPHLPSRELRQFGLVQKVSHPRVGRGEGIVRGSIAERVDAVLEVVDKALGNDTLQPLELRAALKEEVIHRALTVESADTDFVDTSAWLTAMRQGYLQHPEYTDLATVNNMRVTTARIPLVVALVKSCKRNELGEPWLELKVNQCYVTYFAIFAAHQNFTLAMVYLENRIPQDLYGPAFIIRHTSKICFQGYLTPGTCLILKKIVVWRLEKKPYLNVTLNNLQCVIEKSVLD